MADLKPILEELRQLAQQQGSRLDVIDVRLKTIQNMPKRARKAKSRARGQKLLKRPGPGTLLFEFYKSQGIEGCTSCNSLRREMDRLGPDGCEAQLDAIVEKITGRAVMWVMTEVRKKPGAAIRLFFRGNKSFEDMLRVGWRTIKRASIREGIREQVRIHVEKAIADARVHQ